MRKNVSIMLTVNNGNYYYYLIYVQHTAMILEKMTANAGCMPPFMVAHKTPTTIYGHSGLFSFRTVRKEMFGAFSYK